ncbi:VWA domain-containing protein [Nitratiruptor tergarcus]|uniref:Ca-activated chloride channel family protein n=1 Tax=Nitratiruptor tergarcus DSM 16512 TaxID=1069081 RepID=A0A1W1WQN5_9BACT|nr:VWA domain-containing protein [Nitratiruptor tergarcus]SMC08624.1 Ca-activated chloride channel family protein [Nitratiruptor tergarcus DSM 16512]
MSFLYPYLLFFTIPALLLTFLIKKKRAKLPFNPKIVIANQSVNYLLLPFVLALVIVALARPVLKKPLLAQKSVQPLFIAIDFSNSMRAEGRLEKAKRIALDLIQEAPFKISLLIFTTNPLIIAPPTSDKEALKMALASINQDAILTKGTDFAKLLEFIGEFEGKKNLVIISDGGDFKDPSILEKIAKKHDIAIYSVGVGSRSGALIPTREGYLKSEGKLVVTKRNPNFEKLGNFYDEQNYLAIVDDIDKELSQQQQNEIVELFWIPLLIAFLLYFHAYTTLFEKLRTKKLFLLALAIGVHASLLDEFALQRGYKQIKNHQYSDAVQTLSSIPYLEARYAYAVALFHLGKVPEALKVFKTIRSKDPKVKAKIYYNIGLCYEKMRKYEEALRFFIKACQLQRDGKCLKKIEKLAFKKNQKKQLLPFAKQKIVPKAGKKGEKSKQKSAGGSNINLAMQSGSAQGGKKSRGGSLSKKGEAHPVSSKVYELINKGYIDEKRPW